MAIGDIRNLLFANGGLQDNGQDLIARDIERARDDGIGTYNQVRQAYGLKPVTSFAQITSDVTVQKELQQVYGTVDKIDPFEGGMAEDHVAGSDLGPLFTKIIADQFNRLRAGDRFFYHNESWNADELQNHGAGQHAGQGHRGEHGDHEPSNRRLCPGIGERIGPLLGPPPPQSFEPLVTALINDLTARPEAGEVLLVLIATTWSARSRYMRRWASCWSICHRGSTGTGQPGSTATLALPRLRARGQLAELR